MRIEAGGRGCHRLIGIPGANVVTAMGLDAGAVVGPDLRVHGLRGLRVRAASIMPALVQGSPMPRW